MPQLGTTSGDACGIIEGIIYGCESSWYLTLSMALFMDVGNSRMVALESPCLAKGLLLRTSTPASPKNSRMAIATLSRAPSPLPPQLLEYLVLLTALTDTREKDKGPACAPLILISSIHLRFHAFDIFQNHCYLLMNSLLSRSKDNVSNFDIICSVTAFPIMNNCN